jgi:hypothetical protein
MQLYRAANKVHFFLTRSVDPRPGPPGAEAGAAGARATTSPVPQPPQIANW